MHNVVLSSRRGTDQGEVRRVDYSKPEEPVETLSQEEANARYYKEEARKKREMLESIEKEKKKAIDGGLVVRDDGTPITNTPNEKNREEVLTELEETYHRLKQVESESPKLSREEVVAKVQAEQRGEVFEVGSGPVVKEDMNDEEYAAKLKEIEGRDRERLALENAPFDPSDLPTVGSEGDSA